MIPHSIIDGLLLLVGGFVFGVGFHLAGRVVNR
jgi:hypothetical protein